jgi:PAS domain-containing protein
MRPPFWLLPVVVIVQQGFNVLYLVVEFAIDAGIGKNPTIPEGLQGSFADMQGLHNILPVNPGFLELLHFTLPKLLQIGFDELEVIRKPEDQFYYLVHSFTLPFLIR